MLFFIRTQQSPTMLPSLFLHCLIFHVYSLFTPEALTRASSSSSFVIVVMLAGSIATLRVSASGGLTQDSGKDTPVCICLIGVASLYVYDSGTQYNIFTPIIGITPND
eukprot:GHVU01178414.1.p1 GENE.GHVU01178414.1~~GHVU01178414.1.p1  ORF type:complete len:108 (-),score=6.75 GHVU01178414.1:6-329(-)